MKICCCCWNWLICQNRNILWRWFDFDDVPIEPCLLFCQLSLWAACLKVWWGAGSLETPACGSLAARPLRIPEAGCLGDGDCKAPRICNSRATTRDPFPFEENFEMFEFHSQLEQNQMLIYQNPLENGVTFRHPALTVI